MRCWDIPAGNGISQLIFAYWAGNGMSGKHENAGKTLGMGMGWEFDRNAVPWTTLVWNVSSLINNADYLDI